MRENIETKDEYLEEILHKISFYLESAMEFIVIDKTVRIDTVQDLKDFNSQSLTTQDKNEKNKFL